MKMELECNSRFAECNFAWTWTSSAPMSNNGRLFKTNVLQTASAIVSGVPLSKVRCGAKHFINIQ